MSQVDDDRCKNCGRFTSRPEDTLHYHGRVVRATVVHDYYGCDTGCCGYTTYGYDERGNETCHHFEFDHQDEDTDEGFRQFVAETVAYLFGPHVAFDMAECEMSVY